jgi:hypothetical protein
MKFYFDESGEFVVPERSTIHRAAVVMGVAVADPSERKLNDAYADFVARLDDAEKENGEPKGRLLTADHQVQFCEMLDSVGGISITPVTLDLSSLADWHMERFPQRMNEHLKSLVADFPETSAFKRDMETLAKQFGKLALPQALRLYAWADCFHEAIEQAIIHLSTGEYEEAWGTNTFYVDPVQTRARNIEERVFSDIIPGWLCAWMNRRTPLIKGVHTPENKFVQKFVSGTKFDIGKLIIGNIAWVSSVKSIGIQIADIAAYMTYRAVTDLDDTRGAISRFGLLMLRSSPYHWTRGPGLFTAIPDGIPITFDGKYLLIREHMKKTQL